MVYNGYYKVMSNIPKMGHLPIPVYIDYIDQKYAKVYGNYIYINVRTFKYTNWYFILPPEPRGLAPPPHI